MSEAEQRRQRWKDALRAWIGAQDALDGAIGRYVEGYPAVSRPVLAQHLGDALAAATGALAGLQRALERDGEEGPLP